MLTYACQFEVGTFEIGLRTDGRTRLTIISNSKHSQSNPYFHLEISKKKIKLLQG